MVWFIIINPLYKIIYLNIHTTVHLTVICAYSFILLLLITFWIFLFWDLFKWMYLFWFHLNMIHKCKNNIIILVFEPSCICLVFYTNVCKYNILINVLFSYFNFVIFCFLLQRLSPRPNLKTLLTSDLL